MYSLKNESLSLQFKKHGAELCSIRDIREDFEYLWQANPDVWPRHAPVLFPFVGKLKDNYFRHKNSLYSLPQHGFARDMEFTQFQENGNALCFKLTDTPEMQEHFPFPFELEIHYRLEERTLATTYRILNTGREPMLFSIGAHPGFNLFPECPFDDHFLEWDKPEKLKRHLLSHGLFNGKTEAVQSEGNTTNLSRELFEKDALVFKNLNSETVTLRARNSDKFVKMDFAGFPYLGIWAKPGGDFICLEPWHGLADNVNTAHLIEEKEGILSIEPGKTFKAGFKITV